MYKKVNFALIIPTIIIFSFGGITLLSTSKNLLHSYLSHIIIGFILYFIIAVNDYSILKYIWKHIYGISIILLIITHFVAETRFGAARWISIGSFNLQASEISKLSVIIFLSFILSEFNEKINNIAFLTKVILMITPTALLIILQPDLGTTIVILGIFLGLMFFAGLKKIYIVIFFVIAGLLSSPIWYSLKDYQQARILVFINPTRDVLGSGYNVIQSLIAIGSGGILGKGFGQGTQSNLNFLPAHWTDFIFASFAEEWGFLGVALLLSAYLFLLISILFISYKAEDLFGKFLCIGSFLMIFIQFVINIGMNLGIMPVTGVTLPLMSYGGSSLLIVMISLGLVHSVWLKTKF